MSKKGRPMPGNLKATLRRLLQYLRPYRLRLLLVLLAILVSSGAAVAGSYYLKPLFNNYIMPFVGQQNPDLSGFIRLMTIMAGIYILGAVCTYIYSRLMLVISTNTLAQIRQDMFRHMQGLPLKYFDTHAHGELMSLYTNDTDALHDTLSMGLPQLLASAVTLTGVFCAMLFLSPALTVLVLVMLGVMLLAVRLIGRRSGYYFQRQQAAIGSLNGYVEEMIGGQKLVKVFQHEEASKQDFAGLNAELCRASTSAHTFANILMPVMMNLSYIHYALTAALGAVLAVCGWLDLGTLAAFLQMTRQFAQPVTQISQQFNNVLLALAGAERIFKMLDEKQEFDEGTVELRRQGQEFFWQLPDGSTRPVRGEVRLQDVVFGYMPEKEVLHGVSFYAKPGQKIALVGSTGAGKTTITNLLNRFYDIGQGQITYDGIDIRQIKKADLRRSMAFVLQDSHLFSGTIRENIRYGRLDATDAEVEAAARLANAEHFIQNLPQGFETLISGDGGNLSQGQRQLLTIARAAVANPAVLVLDEATSSIDTRTEALIEKGMNRLMEGRTVFVIAHRLSTVRNANAILVIEDGRIIERGDHADLLQQHGRYYQLYTGLFELGLKDCCRIKQTAGRVLKKCRVRPKICRCCC